MPPWKQILLSAYLYGTLPCRRLANRAAAQRGAAPVMVLFYHRVADDVTNGWTISTRQFQRHVRWLRGNFDLLSLADAQQRIRSGFNQRPAVCITFDDGYADNCRSALPLLIEQRIACTYFVSTRNVLEGIPFPHDVAIGKPLAPNTLDQLKLLADAGIEIGAHTRTHADLGKIDDPQVLYDEVVAARDDLAEALGQPINYFAFPYGLHPNLNASAFHLAKEAGFDGVCSAYGGYNLPGDDPFHLQRIHADPEMVRLINWLTVDPRKLASVKRFDYLTGDVSPLAEVVAS